MTDTSGLTSYAPFAKWDHDSQSWKTSEATCLLALTLSSLTLPAWGGLHDGELCEHPTPALATSAPDCSSLPTPVADHSRGLPQTGTDYASLPNVVIGLLPTPTAHPENRASPEWGYPTLRDAVNLLPTPSAADGMGGHNSRSGERGDELLLPGLVKTFLPTPRAQNGEPRNQNIYARPADQPQNLENALHGVITAPPSSDGSASSDDQHPHLLSLDGLGLPA
jgi:hypothetical protein